MPINQKIRRKNRPEFIKKREKAYEKLLKYFCINVVTLEKKEMNIRDMMELNINPEKINRAYGYWRNVKTKTQKTIKDWIIIHPKDYKPEFDYLNYSKQKEYWKNYVPVEPKDYYKKKNPEDIIPYSQRNILRRPVLMKHKETGVEEILPSVMEAISKYNLVSNKVYKCLQREFGKNSHREHYFKYID